jgi:pseudouridine synthase
MAAAGIGSRRACEALIEEGRVAVNGEIVRRLPVLVTPGLDRISIDNEPLERYMPKSMRRAFAETRDPRRPPLVYVLLYKPANTLTTMSDPDHRRTVADLVHHPSGIRLYPVGRLDYDTLGLLLLTNDGELANRLTHPRYEVHKTYRAVVKGAMNPEQIEHLRAGTYLTDRREGRTTGASRTKGVDLTIVRTEPTRTILDITLKEGRNRQVRRILADAGCPVRKLVRIAMGPLLLKGVKPGEWRDLTPKELRELQHAAQGRGPKAPDDRALVRSHALKLGRNRERRGVTSLNPDRKGGGSPFPASNPDRKGGGPSLPSTSPARKARSTPSTNPSQRPVKPAPKSSFPLSEPPPRLRT